MIRTLLTTVAALCAMAGMAQAQVTRTGPPTAFIASTVTVPAGTDLIFLSGQLPNPVTPATATTPAVYGDTEAQAESAFVKIADLLKTQGLTEGDVVSMTVYLAAPAGGAMDFAGMMKAYGRHYGTATQPNKPSRSTVQVAALVAPGALIEVEVTAAKKK
jgi:enamine deaminase RidA (YjgF/YER057c/UK114 family)